MVAEGKSIKVWGKGVFGESAPDSPKTSDLRPRVLKEFFAEFDVSSVKQVVAGPSFSAILSEAGTVFTFGAERWFNPSAKEDLGIELHFQKWDQISNVIMIDVGDTFMAALTDSGDLYTWGTGQYGQLGLDSMMTASTPQLVKSLEGSVKQVACGFDNIAAVTKNGELYTWGRAQSGSLGHGNEQDMKTPTLVKSLDGITVSQVKVGLSHMAALTDDGIYTWGNNFLGPLGRILGKGKDCDFVPRPIDLIQVGAQVTEENLKGADEINFVQLECLRFNTLALSEDGQVFSCGKGGVDGGGHGDSPHTLFCLIESIKNVKVKSLSSCKANHVAALAENGDIWIWGNGESGQLGLGETQSQAYPKKLDALANNKIVQISCGATHTIAISLVELDKDEMKQRRDERLKKLNAANTSAPVTETSSSKPTATPAPAPTPAAAPAPAAAQPSTTTPAQPIYHPDTGRQGEESDSSGDSESDDDVHKKTAPSTATPMPQQKPAAAAAVTPASPVRTTPPVSTAAESSDDEEDDIHKQKPAPSQEAPASDKPAKSEEPKTPTATTTASAPPASTPAPNKGNADGGDSDSDSEELLSKPESSKRAADQPAKANLQNEKKKAADSDDELVEEPLEPKPSPAQKPTTQQDKPEKPSPTATPEKEEEEKKPGKGKKKGKDSDEEDSDDESGGGKDAVGAADAAARGGHTGFLQKKGDKGLVKGWKKRFFVVDGELIRYFANKGDKKEKGRISVKEMVDLQEGSTKMGFNIVMRGKRVYELKAPSDEEMEKWISVLKDLIKAQKKK